MSKTLSKQDILQTNDAVIEKLEIPEWGGCVFVRSITAAERGQIEASAARFKETKGKDESFARTFTLKFAALALCDEKGVRLFNVDEVEQLAKKNAKPISMISEVAQRLSGFDKKDIEELEKNSESVQAEDLLSV